jgi:pilus assembly protein CpaB
VKRRVLTVALAVLLAALGTGGVLAYVRQADNRALAGQQAVSVLVAGKLIPSGTSAATALRDGLLTTQQLPAASVPSDAMRSVAPGLSSLVLSADVQPGQLLLRPMLVTAVQQNGGLVIPPGMVAVTINLCVPEAVANNVQAGSDVEVFNTYAPKDDSLTAGYNCNPPHEQQAYGGVHTVTVLPRVRVLAVGPASATGQASSQSSSATVATATSGTSATSSSSNVLVTVAVSQANAQRLIQLTVTGLPYLALLTNSSQTRVDTRLVPPSGQRQSAGSPPAKP